MVSTRDAHTQTDQMQIKFSGVLLHLARLIDQYILLYEIPYDLSEGREIKLKPNKDDLAILILSYVIDCK